MLLICACEATCAGKVGVGISRAFHVCPEEVRNVGIHQVVFTVGINLEPYRAGCSVTEVYCFYSGSRHPVAGIYLLMFSYLLLHHSWIHAVRKILNNPAVEVDMCLIIFSQPQDRSQQCIQQTVPNVQQTQILFITGILTNKSYYWLMVTKYIFHFIYICLCLSRRPCTTVNQIPKNGAYLQSNEPQDPLNLGVVVVQGFMGLIVSLTVL